MHKNYILIFEDLLRVLKAVLGSRMHQLLVRISS